jgi:UDP-glucose 4-epimerase
MKTALVTGMAGFIGSHVGESLLNQGFRVVGIDNLKTGKMENLQPWFDSDRCELHNCDITNLNAIRQHFLGVDYVFHNAASKCTVCAEDPTRDMMVNGIGTLNVIIAAQEAGVRKIIHASTGSVNHINSFYGNSKCAGENYYPVFKKYHPGFNYTVLRYHHVYGPRQDDSDKGGVIPIFIRKIFNNEPVTIFGDGLQVRHFTHVLDIVRANLWAMENGDGKAYNVLSDTKVTIRKLAHDLMSAMGRETKVEYMDEKPGDIRAFTATNEEIKADGFTFQKSFNEGLMDTIQWYCRKYEGRRAA